METQNDLEMAAQNELDSWSLEPRPSFQRWCQYAKALYLIGEEKLFEEIWSRINLYSKEERLEGGTQAAWMETSTLFFNYFSKKDDFASAFTYADEILAEHPSHTGARLYRLQEEIKSRSWEGVLHDASILMESIKTGGNPDTSSKQGQAARSWQWLAQSQIANTTDQEPPAWLIEPLTLPVFLFKNRAPNVPTSVQSDGVNLLRLLIEAETRDRCHNDAKSARLLVRYQYDWPHLHWLSMGLDLFQGSEPLCLEKLAEHTVHLL